MKISFEEIDINNNSHFEAFKLWNSEPLMVRNWHRHQEGNDKFSEYTREKFKKWIDENSNEAYSFMILLNNKPVGYGWFAINFHVAKTKARRVAWPSIAIGLEENRNHGLLLIRSISCFWVY